MNKYLTPKLAFTRSAAKLASEGPAVPSDGQICFFDGYFPALKAGSYTLEVRHSLTNAPTPVPTYSDRKNVVVAGPEFAIDPVVVQQMFPPDRGSDVYGSYLPFIVLSDPSLPWERSLMPGQSLPGPDNPTPWVALVVFSESEVKLDLSTQSPIISSTVADLLRPDPDILKPHLPANSVSPEALAERCESIVISGKVFMDVIPALNELMFLSHCRGVNIGPEGQVLISVVLANRFPITAEGSSTRYFAHLVSLEGYQPYLGPNGQPIPPKQTPAGELQDVQLVSLFNWSFVSLPEAGPNFEELAKGLIADQQAQASFAIRDAATGSGPFPAVADRLKQGYVPLDSVAGAGNRTFAWFRGPLSPVVPQPLPNAGNPPTGVAGALTSDQLLIYLEAQGIFDASYAEAWQIGRAIALADSGFSQAIRNYRSAARRALATIIQRAAAGHTVDAEILSAKAGRRRFATAMAEGMGREWTAALSAGPGVAKRQTADLVKAKLPAADEMRSRLAEDPKIGEAIAGGIAAQLDTLAERIANLRCLVGVPFCHLVSRQQLLPAESIRFFYVDKQWLDALQAGAMSLAVQSSQDVALDRATQSVLSARIEQKLRMSAVRLPGASGSAEPACGMLIRSQLVDQIPNLVVSPAETGSPIGTVRDAALGNSLRFLLFDRIPDTVTIGEPYQGIRFGVEDNGLTLRSLTAPVGKQIPDRKFPAAGTEEAFRAAYSKQSPPGVLSVSRLVADLASVLGAPAAGFRAGDFALQLVKAPESQAFPTK